MIYLVVSLFAVEVLLLSMSIGETDVGAKKQNVSF
jgi:hypothetical protein